MMIETDLPQAVKEAIAKPDEKNKTNIQLAISKTQGLKIIVVKNGQQTEQSVALAGKEFDYTSLHKALQEVKKQHPEVFSLEFSPDADVPYAEIVKMMDEARKSRDKDVRFPLYDAKENKTVMTDYMFPDVVFTNMMDG
jgi:biopolymer transport protein ExbD